MYKHYHMKQEFGLEFGFCIKWFYGGNADCRQSTCITNWKGAAEKPFCRQIYCSFFSFFYLFQFWSSILSYVCSFVTHPSNPRVTNQVKQGLCGRKNSSTPFCDLTDESSINFKKLEVSISWIFFERFQHHILYDVE